MVMRLSRMVYFDVPKAEKSVFIGYPKELPEWIIFREGVSLKRCE
jgi:hypothetical protein